MAAAVRVAALRLCQHEFGLWRQQRGYSCNAATLVRTGSQSVHVLRLPPGHLRPGWSSTGKIKRTVNLARACGDSGVVLLSTKVCPDGSIMFKFGSRDDVVSESSYSQKEGKNTLWAETGAEEAVAQEAVNGTPLLGVQDRRAGDAGQRVGVQNVENWSSGKVGSDSVDPQDNSNGCSVVETVDSTLHTLAAEDIDLEVGTRGPESGPVGSRAGLEEHSGGSKVPDVKEVEGHGQVADGGSRQGPGDVSKDEEGCKLESASAMLPKADKVATGGEDAFFITETNWIGVADGVGGWAELGVNAGIYSRELMANCRAFALDLKDSGKPSVVLSRAHRQTTSKGSATAILAVLRGKTLYVANVGDSGFLLIRSGKCVGRSSPMQYGFNFPLQLSIDNYERPDNYELPVEKGDVVILGTDGLFDNLFEHQIVEVVEVFKEGRGAGPRVVANFLATLAQQASKSKSGQSPFSTGARAVGINFVGGKEDDITVVVSYVK